MFLKILFTKSLIFQCFCKFSSVLPPPNHHIPTFYQQDWLWPAEYQKTSGKVLALSVPNTRNLYCCWCSGGHVMGPKEPGPKEAELGLPTITSYPILLRMTSALRGRGVSQFLTKGRELVWIWHCQGGRGSKILKFKQTSYVHGLKDCIIPSLTKNNPYNLSKENLSLKYIL